MWSWWDCIQWWNAGSDGLSWAAMLLPMMLWPVVVIGGVIALLVMLIRSGRMETPRSEGRRQTPLEILSERFARGEIDQHEYEARKGLLPQL